ncbi:MAG: hypothetical protein HRU20_06115 [Pseudomonadales bacterium]|nr:hypothetical protein [Pseudomonadales bacterium]
MTMPTEQELQQALIKAKSMRETGQDDDFVAKALLNHHYRLTLLQHVLDAAGHYLHSGNGNREHQKLLKAIEDARQSEYRPGQETHRGDDSLLI